jgi:hypothetical protein
LALPTKIRLARKRLTKLSVYCHATGDSKS